jgi:protein-S-isoprenylcysteine O-methyltransferase Ste14
MKETSPEEDRNRLNAAGLKVLVGTFLGPFIQAAILFGCAGRLDIPRAWICIGASFILMNSGTVMLWRINPELLNHRGQWKKKRDTKRWDRILLPAFGIPGFYIAPAVIGLDIGRYRWSSLGIHFLMLGLILYAVGTAVLNWAMAANPYFETTVRIQNDRNQRVITTGPYRIVRHPGYVGAILWAVAPPLIAGSFYGLIPAGVAAIALIIRTSWEDKTLQLELDGYAEFARRVKYRLFPGIW